MRVRDGAVYIVSRIVPSGLGFITSILLTWLLTPEGYGLYGLGMGVVMLGNNITFDWLSLTLLRWFQTHSEQTSFMPTMLTLFAASCAALLACLAIATVLGLTGSYTTFAWVLLPGVWAYGWFEFSSRIQVGRFRPMRYLAMNFARNGLILASAVVIGYTTQSAYLVLITTFISLVVGGSLFVGDGALHTSGGFSVPLARSLAAYGGPMALSMIFYGLATSMNRVMLEALSTTEAVGAITIGFTLVQASLGTIASGLGSATYSNIVRAVESGDAGAADTEFRRCFTFQWGLLLPSSAGLILVSPAIARTLTNPHYYQAIVTTVPWLAIGALALAMRAYYVDYAFQIRKRTGALVQVTGAMAVVNFVLDLLLIPRFSYVGAAAAMTIAFVLSLVHAILLSRRIYKLPFPAREAANVVLATAVMAVALLVIPYPQGTLGLVVQLGCGGVAYGLAAMALNVMGVRDIVLHRIGAFRRQQQEPIG